MTVQQLYEKKIDVIKKGIDLVNNGAPFTLPFEEYSNLFEFSIKALHEKPTQIYYCEDEKFRIIAEIINNHDAYLFLNFSSIFQHEILSGDFNELQLEPIIIFFKKTILNVEETNKLLKFPLGFKIFVQGDTVYEAKLLVKTKPEKTGYEHDFFFPDNLIFTDDLASLKNKSFLPFTILPNKHIPAYISGSSYFMNNETNEITVVNSQKLIVNSFKKDHLKTFYSNVYNNSLLVHADYKGHSYLYESYCRGTVLYDLSGHSVIFEDLKKEHYNYR